MALFEVDYPTPRLIEAVQFRVNDTPWPLEVIQVSEGAATQSGTPYAVQTAQGVSRIFDLDWIERRMVGPRVWARAAFEAMTPRKVLDAG